MKIKKLLALLAVLAILVGIFAMPAAALSGFCPDCGKAAEYTHHEYIRSQRVDYCSRYNGVHNHTVTTPYKLWNCPKCGSFVRNERSTETCPYA